MSPADELRGINNPAPFPSPPPHPLTSAPTTHSHSLIKRAALLVLWRICTVAAQIEMDGRDFYLRHPSERIPGRHRCERIISFGQSRHINLGGRQWRRAS